MKTPIQLLIGRLKKIPNNQDAIEIAEKMYMEEKKAIEEAYFAGWKNTCDYFRNGTDVQTASVYYQNKYEKK